MNDGLGVAARAVAVALPLEVGAQGCVVVDLSIECDPDAVVLVGERLMSAGEIDDGKAPEAEEGGRVGVKALVIGAAMAHAIGHATDGFGAFLPRKIAEDSADTAHRTGP